MMKSKSARLIHRCAYRRLRAALLIATLFAAGTFPAASAADLKAAGADRPAAAQGVVLLHVAPDGNNAWSGRLAAPNAARTDGPLATICQARDQLRKLKATGGFQQPVRVQIHGGTYRLSEPITFAPEDSGSETAPITYAAAPGQRPILSGGVPVAGWKKQPGGPIWAAIVPGVKEGAWHPRSLFVNGRRATPARTPNEGRVYQMAGPLEAIKDRAAARRDPETRLGFRFEDEELKRWAGLDDAVVVVYHAWTTSRHLIESLDAARHEVRFRNPSVWPMGWWGKERFYVENVREALDAPGEFYLDRKTGLLSYYPRPGEDMTKAEAIVPRLEELLRLEGEPAAGKLVERLGFEGLSFQYTDWDMPKTGRVDGQAMAFLKKATVFARGARYCTFQRCEIARTGGYGLWLERGAKQNRVVECRLHDLGAGGVRLGETSLPDNPQEQAERNEVYNCFIHDGGRVFHGGHGVWLGKTSLQQGRAQ